MFLLPLCLLPYSTAWVGASLGGAFSWAIYGWTLIAISAANMLIVLAAFRGGGRLIAGGASGREMLYRLARSAIPGLAFLIGMLVLAGGRTILAHMCWVLIGPLFWLAELIKPRAVEPAADV